MDVTNILGWMSFGCIVLIGLLEPKEPKKDGRFKTGYKNNATVPKKSNEIIKAQLSLLVIGVFTGILWYLSK